MKILVINGPNMNMLGIREPDIYGKDSYYTFLNKTKDYADKNGVNVTFYQSNHEGDLVDAIQQAYFDKIDGIIINPAAYTHTSVAIADAVKAVNIPTVEVHLSDTNNREEFRKISYVRSVVNKTISGFGIDGYLMAIDFLLKGE